MLQCWRRRGICPLFSSPPLRIWQLKSPHSRVFAIQGKTKKLLMPGGQPEGGRCSSQLELTVHYVRQDWILSQKFGSKLFWQFWQKKNKTNCQKCIANSTRTANCSKTLLLMFVAILAKIHLIGIAGKNLVFKRAVSRNSAKLGNYKMPVKLRET